MFSFNTELSAVNTSLKFFIDDEILDINPAQDEPGYKLWTVAGIGKNN